MMPIVPGKKVLAIMCCGYSTAESGNKIETKLQWLHTTGGEYRCVMIHNSLFSIITK